MEKINDISWDEYFKTRTAYCKACTEQVKSLLDTIDWDAALTEEETHETLCCIRNIINRLLM